MKFVVRPRYETNGGSLLFDVKDNNNAIEVSGYTFDRCKAKDLAEAIYHWLDSTTEEKA